ncbi:PREDICTED: major royal jelly protein 1-like [Dinoponera quadriceps]|uniref:Major royal jelly protein 1-like n=1 Tax=Dinoponera quadriceps TaxID=609295 RepID=A0A6P3WTC4_DINQU|nr:PREDICTED: major royal jelly protein 1-like [Dinoponera quadriceps]
MELIRALVLFFGLVRSSQPQHLEVVYQWKYLDWVWPNIHLTGKNYTLGNAFTQDVDIDRQGRVFVTSPQWLEGVPISLSLVTKGQGPGGRLLVPYPNWTWHTPHNCESIISVYRLAIDECNRLWVVDSGRMTMKSVCPVKILIFDLATDQLIHKYVVPDDQVLYGKASLVTPIVDVGKTCLDTYLYVADVDQNGLVIYDLYRDHSWRVNNTRGNAFGPDFDEDAMNITIAGEWFDLTDGTLGMSLSPLGYFNHRYLYFNSLASYYQKYADTFSLARSEFWEPAIFQSNYKRASQAGVQATSRRGVIFFQLVQLTAIACWDIGKPFTPENVVIIAQDEKTLQYVSGIKVITNRAGEEELWFNTNRLQKTINMSLRPTETNFRIIKGKVDDIIRGTRCESSGVRTPVPDNSVFWHQI